MAIALAFIDLVVPIATIRAKYPGGWEQCLRDHEHLVGGRVWYDEHLFRDGTMSPDDMGRLIVKWVGLGFAVPEETDTKRAWTDLCVVESLFGGPTLPCDWLVFDQERWIAYLAGTEPGKVVGGHTRGGAPIAGVREAAGATHRKEATSLEFKFWTSDKHGLIRRPRKQGVLGYPEVWHKGRWEYGSKYVLDAVTGMGEDLYSCGEWAFDIDREKAEVYASEHGIDLDAENLDDWGTDLVRMTAKAVREWHEGQVDKAGAPYFEHRRRVSRALDDEDGQLVGLLHDVIEDAGVSPEQLRDLAFDDEVVDAFLALTRSKKEDLDDYYRRVRANPLALRVKLADLRDNLDPARLALLDEKTREELKAKYAHALEAL